MSPIHPSPNHDWGYDVSDYEGVHPDYGTLADFDRLIGESREQRPAVGRRVQRDRADAEPARGPDDAAGDFAAIGDQDIGEHGGSLAAAG